MSCKSIKEMQEFCEENVDMPDGAFFAMAEERGITVDDWERYSKHCKKQK